MAANRTPPEHADASELQGDAAIHWTVVSRFERDGREHLVIVRREPHRVARDLLSARELQVVRLLGCGRSIKEIAFDLGLCWSTVRVLLWRAAVKLRVRGKRGLKDIALQLDDAVVAPVAS
jgi:DNA-binding NarL/FixJ family response regulator